MDKEARKYMAELVKLTSNVAVFLNLLDNKMLEPSTVKRDQCIVELTNWLTMINHAAMRFTLKYSWTKINRLHSMEPKKEDKYLTTDEIKFTE